MPGTPPTGPQAALRGMTVAACVLALLLGELAAFGGKEWVGGVEMLLPAAVATTVAWGALLGLVASRISGSSRRRFPRLLALAMGAFIAGGAAVAALWLGPVVLHEKGISDLLGLFWAGAWAAGLALPYAIVPLAAAALALEAWTRPPEAPGGWPPARTRRLLLGAMIAASAALVAAFVLRLMVPVRLLGEGGRPCHVSEGMTQGAVRERCGRPTDFGVQAEAVDLEAPELGFCSVPIDVYGDRLVLYDCRLRVEGVVTGRDYQRDQDRFVPACRPEPGAGP